MVTHNKPFQGRKHKYCTMMELVVIVLLHMNLLKQFIRIYQDIHSCFGKNFNVTLVMHNGAAFVYTRENQEKKNIFILRELIKYFITCWNQFLIFYIFYFLVVYVQQVVSFHVVSNQKNAKSKYKGNMNKMHIHFVKQTITYYNPQALQSNLP